MCKLCPYRAGGTLPVESRSMAGMSRNTVGGVSSWIGVVVRLKARGAGCQSYKKKDFSHRILPERGNQNSGTEECRVRTREFGTGP